MNTTPTAILVLGAKIFAFRASGLAGFTLFAVFSSSRNVLRGTRETGRRRKDGALQAELGMRAPLKADMAKEMELLVEI